MSFGREVHPFCRGVLLQYAHLPAGQPVLTQRKGSSSEALERIGRLRAITANGFDAAGWVIAEGRRLGGVSISPRQEVS